ncbi:MAG: hypothetical protein B6244_12970 [Candidatus Cloacimonetes bacterium 4572_55]|nr:MAG: hypothetical protein B6244_12970 [Candidatus Cloacimonetes bacterium 4572_55]
MLNIAFRRKELNSLESNYEYISERIRRIRNAHAIETDPSIRFKFEKQLQDVEEERDHAERDIERLEQEIELLESGIIQPNQPLHERNPYRVGGGLIGNYVIRKKELRKIRNLVDTGQHVAIRGDRAIGKTTLLNQFCQEKSEEDRILVKLDGQRIRDIKDFVKRVTRKIDKQVRIGRMDNFDEDDIEELLYDITASRKLIIVIDEFDQLTKKDFDKYFFDLLRSYGNDPAMNIVYIVASRTKLIDLPTLRKDQDISSPFFNIFNTIRMYPFTDPEIDELLALAGDRIDLFPYRQELIDLGGHFPHFLQMACWEYFDQLSHYGKVDRDRVRSTFQDRTSDHFRYITERGFSAEEREMLYQLIKDGSIQQNYTSDQMIKRGYLINGKLFSVEFDPYLRQAWDLSSPQP